MSESPADIQRRLDIAFREGSEMMKNGEDGAAYFEKVRQDLMSGARTLLSETKPEPQMPDAHPEVPSAEDIIEELIRNGNLSPEARYAP